MICERIEDPDGEFLLDLNTVVFGKERVKKFSLCPEFGDNMSLGDVSRNYPGGSVITVISKTYRRGVVYKHGNHGDFWERVGETCGFA